MQPNIVYHFWCLIWLKTCFFLRMQGVIGDVMVPSFACIFFMLSFCRVLCSRSSTVPARGTKQYSSFGPQLQGSGLKSSTLPPNVARPFKWLFNDTVLFCRFVAAMLQNHCHLILPRRRRCNGGMASCSLGGVVFVRLQSCAIICRKLTRE